MYNNSRWLSRLIYVFTNLRYTFTFDCYFSPLIYNVFPKLRFNCNTVLTPSVHYREKQTKSTVNQIPLQTPHQTTTILLKNDNASNIINLTQ